MKKFLAIFFFSLISTIASPARADLVLGADVYKTFMDTSQELEAYSNDNYDMVAAVLGFDFKGVGIEGFYQQSDDTSNDYNRDSKLQAYGVDFVMRLPTSDYIDFVGSAGYVKYKLETLERDWQTDGLRLGLGIQFNINQHIGFRAMYHYSVLTEEINDIKTINEISAGIRLKF